MAEFSPYSLDSFFCGLASLWLAAVAHALHRRPGQRLPWSWLAWFGWMHGLSQWLDALTAGQPVPPAIQTVRLALMVGSLVALVEFGRRGLQRLSARTWIDWVYLPLVCLLAAGVFFGSRRDPAALSAASGFPLRVVWASCVVLAATGLWLYGRRRESPDQRTRFFRRWQLPTAVALLVAVGWAGARWHAGRAEAQARLVPASETNGPSEMGGARILAELEPEPATRERLAIQRLRSSLPLLLFNFGLVVLLVAGWAAAQRMSQRHSAPRRARSAKDEGRRTKD